MLDEVPKLHVSNAKFHWSWLGLGGMGWRVGWGGMGWGAVALWLEHQRTWV